MRQMVVFVDTRNVVTQMWIVRPGVLAVYRQKSSLSSPREICGDAVGDYIARYVGPAMCESIWRLFRASQKNVAY